MIIIFFIATKKPKYMNYIDMIRLKFLHLFFQKHEFTFFYYPKKICHQKNLGKRDLTALVKKLETEVSKCRKMRASLAGGASLAALKDGLQMAETNLSANLDSYQETLAAKQEENEATDTALHAKVEEANGNLEAIQTALKDAAEKLAEAKKGK